MSDAEPKSPCVSICVLSEDDVCQGCFRSADEITDWFMATSEQKRNILRSAQQRREASTPFRLR